MMQENVPLAGLTTMGVGGRARKLVFAETDAQLRDAVPIGEYGTATGTVVIGRGSNLLVSDNGFDGTVVAVRTDRIRMTPEGVYASAGVTLGRLAKFCLEHELTGLEWAAGIPGSVGGAAMMNAGAFGSDFGACALYVDTVFARNNACDCGFSYRHSGLHEPVVGACFAVRGDSRERIAARMRDFATLRRQKQPRGASAGSVFKAADKPAAVYLDGAGLKGRRIGGAEVSRKHANFIINSGGATAADVKALIECCKATVYERYGVILVEEVRYLGEF